MADKAITKFDMDFDKILSEYDDKDSDFGFSSISEDEYNKAITETAQTVESYKIRLREVEKLILPFLNKLFNTADQAYIHWPNRGPQIKSQIEKIVKLTRG